MNVQTQVEMRRRIADCRERLRRSRAAQRISLTCAAPSEGSAQGEAEAWDSPAFEAHGEETRREG
jgi:hypothetical protein